MAEESAKKRPPLGALLLRIVLYVGLLLAAQVILTNVFGVPDFGPGSEIRGGVLAFFVIAAVNAALRHFDRPRGYAVLVTRLLASVAWGLLAALGLLHFFADGPGWPVTPWAAFAAAAGAGLLRGHTPLLNEAVHEREKVRGRLPGKAYVALAFLIVGYAVLGVAGNFLFRAFSALIPDAGRFFLLAAAVYVLYGAKLLLSFSALEAEPSREGFWAWFKANFVQNALVGGLLAAYVAFRPDLRDAVPYYPLWEFGFAVALFGLVLQRLRSRLKRGLQEAPIASERKPHRQQTSPLTEPDYDSLHAAVSGFVERGRNLKTYEEAVVRAARVEGETREILAPIATHREPVPPQPLPLAWGTAALLATAAGSALALFAFIQDNLGAPRGPSGWPVAIPISLGVFFLWAHQLGGLARRHVRPRLSVGFAVATAVFLLSAFLLFANTVGTIPEVPLFVWSVVAGILALLIGRAILLSLKLQKELRDDPYRFFPEEGADVRNHRERERARKSLLTIAFIAALAYLVLPPVLEWAVGRIGMPEAWLRNYRAILGPLAPFLGGVGAGAGLRLAGLARERPRAMRLEAAARERRLAVHKEVMARIERV